MRPLLLEKAAGFPQHRERFIESFTPMEVDTFPIACSR